MAVAAALQPRFGKRGIIAGAAAAGALFSPGPAAASAVGLLALEARRRVAARRKELDLARRDVVLLGELVGLGLSAGLSFVAALSMAANRLAPMLGAEVRAVVRDSHHRGLSFVLAGADGIAAPFFSIAARAVGTGAPLGSAIERFLDHERGARRADDLAAARRLPVRLLLPLALLILPGFVILALGPALVEAIDRLGIALPSALGR